MRWVVWVVFFAASRPSEAVMSKLSRTFASSPGGGPGMRLVLMSVILTVVLVMLIAVRWGALRSVSHEREPEPPPPAEAPSDTAPIQARVNTGDNGIEIRVLYTGMGPRRSSASDNAVVHTATYGTAAVPAGAPTTTPDNTTVKAPGTAGDLFDNVLDGHYVRWVERDAYHHVVAMAWDLARKGTPEAPLQVRQLELLADPKQYRAKLIRVKGALLRVRRRAFDPDEKRPDRPLVHYECAVKSVDEDPWIVLVFEDPKVSGVEAGRDAVWTDAYFFKVWGYNDGRMKVPLLMGFRVHKLKARNVLGPVASVVLGGCVAVVILLWLWLRHGRRQSEVLRQRLAREDTEDLEIPEPASLPRDEVPGPS